MKQVGLGNVLTEMKNQILQIRHELLKMEKSFTPIPEMIETTNLLRENESLKLSNNKKTELISAYENYTKQIENLVSAAFEIQNDLRDVVKAQSELIETKRKKKRVKSKTKKLNSKIKKRY